MKWNDLRMLEEEEEAGAVWFNGFFGAFCDSKIANMWLSNCNQ